MTRHDHGARQARHDQAQQIDPTHDASACVCCCVDCTDEPSEREHHLHSLRGKRVEVTLIRSPLITMVGTLTGFDREGRVQIRNNKGATQWCWPNLATHELPT